MPTLWVRPRPSPRRPGFLRKPSARTQCSMTSPRIDEREAIDTARSSRPAEFSARIPAPLPRPQRGHPNQGRSRGRNALDPQRPRPWPTADFYERELCDMFGVVCTGHPCLRRLLMPPVVAKATPFGKTTMPEPRKKTPSAWGPISTHIGDMLKNDLAFRPNEKWGNADKPRPLTTNMFSQRRAPPPWHPTDSCASSCQMMGN